MEMGVVVLQRSFPTVQFVRLGGQDTSDDGHVVEGDGFGDGGRANSNLVLALLHYEGDGRAVDDPAEPCHEIAAEDQGVSVFWVSVHTAPDQPIADMHIGQGSAEV